MRRGLRSEGAVLVGSGNTAIRASVAAQEDSSLSCATHRERQRAESALLALHPLLKLHHQVRCFCSPSEAGSFADKWAAYEPRGLTRRRSKLLEQLYEENKKRIYTCIVTLPRSKGISVRMSMMMAPNLPNNSAAGWKVVETGKASLVRVRVPYQTPCSFAGRTTAAGRLVDLRRRPATTTCYFGWR